MDQNMDVSNMNSSQRESIMSEVKTQLAVANAQELIQRLSDKCIKKCIPKPGTSLSGSEEKCLGFCMERFMDTWNQVSKSYQQRIQREGGLS